MSWFKKQKQHDKLCTENPCICFELERLRDRQAYEKSIENQAYRYGLAQEALDGEQE